MKRKASISRFLSAAAVAAVTVLPSFTSCDKYDDSQLKESIKDIEASIKNLEERTAALEKKVIDNISAIQSMVSLGSISSCEYDSETGKTVITLVDGKKIEIDQSVKGISLMTVVEKDGKYYWGICKDNETVLLEVNGKNVPVEVTPSARISDQGEWQLSTDGGQTWVSTGIFQNTGNDNTDKEEVIFFKDVKEDGDFLVLTLANGKEIKVEVVGEASFSATETSLWFTKTGYEKMVNLQMKNVKAYTITEKPEGWKVQIIEEILHITSPGDLSEADKSGTVKILALFNSGVNPEIVSVDVQYEDEFTMEADKYGKVTVAVSEHVEEDYQGYILAAWKESDYTPEAALEWLNTTGYGKATANASKEFNVSELADSYSEHESYVIFAVSYIPSRLIASGDRKYAAEDLITALYSPTTAKVAVSELRFDYADLSVTFTDIPEYYAGIAVRDEWDNYMRDNIIEMLRYDGLESMTAPTYQGPASRFPDGADNITIKPGVQYVVWVLPAKEGTKYTEDEFITKTFSTPGIKAGASLSAPGHTVKTTTYGGFSADVIPASGAYKTYATILPAASIPSTDEELANEIVKANKSSEADKILSVSTNSYSPDSEVYLLAVSVTKDGQYGKILKEQVKLKQLVYSDAIGISDCKVEYGLGDVTLTLTFKGEPYTISYFASSYSLYDDATMERLMAMGQYGEATLMKISSLNAGKSLTLTGLNLGMQYTFYAIVKDADGNPSHLYKTTFIPSSNLDYILSSKADYTYGMPQLGGTWAGNTTFKLSVDKPAECVKYWLYRGDPEYFTGDVWIDSDKLVMFQLYGVEEFTESIQAKSYSNMYNSARIYMVWLDDQGKYHAIYEYNPNNQ